MPYRHDPNLYTTVPTRTPRASMGLARALLAAATKDLVDPLLTRLTLVHQNSKTLQTAWIDANRPSTSSEIRSVADLGIDRAHSAVRSRLQDWVDVEDEDHGKRAAQLLGLLYPTGLDFINMRYLEQWPESDRRIALIDKDELEEELVFFIGESFMARLRKAHIKYGEALNITGGKAVEPDPIRIREALDALRTSISGYARLALGLTPDDDDDAIAATEALLEPLIRYRKPRAKPEAQAEAPEPAEAPEQAEQAEQDEPVDAPLPEPPKGE